MFGSSDYSRTVWMGLAFVLAGALLFVLYSFVGTFVLGLFLYYSSRPIYVRLRHRIQPPTLAAAVALFVLVLPVVLLFWYTAALGIGELRSFAELDLSAYEGLLAPYTDFAGLTAELQTVLQTLTSDPEQLLAESRLQGILTDIAAAMTQYLGVILTGLLHLFIAVALAFYLLRDGDRLVAWTRTHFTDETLVTYGREVDADLKTVFFGNILNALLIGTVGAIVFSILAAIAPTAVPVPVPILLGLLAGAGSLVPVVGMKIVYVPVSLYLAGLAVISDPQLLWFPVIFFAVTFVVVDTIPDLVIRPYVSGRNLHVGAVMFAYILGPLLFGWYGLFLGPLLLVVIADFARVVVPDLFGSGVESVSTSLTGDRVDGEKDVTTADGDARDPDIVAGADESGQADDSDEKPDST
ncbi:AI-2E family transporter [Halobellus rarus]|uniref:AI-2E family transporter n=1 Tax=Halobellus rarus TaxID=1126237 RepID=A0ABD6CL93_9EURY|nr:AI-2E family transporter [Halobellus rarus]